MKLGNRQILWIILLLTLASRLMTFADAPYQWDEFNYMAAVDHFDLAQERPHFPGNWWRIQFARGVNLLVDDPHLALQMTSLLALLVLVWATYSLVRKHGERLFGVDGRQVEIIALIAASLLAVSPALWRFSILAMGNVFSALIAVGVVSLLLGDRRSWVWAAGLIGFAAGIRLDSIFLGPLWIAWGVRSGVKPRELLQGVLVGIAGVALWIVPTLLDTAEPMRGLQQSIGMLTRAGEQMGAPLQGWFGRTLYFSISAAAGIFTTIGPALLVPLLWPRTTGGLWRNLPSETRYLLLWWFLPTMLLIVTTHFQPGYLLLLAPMLAWLLAFLIVRLPLRAPLRWIVFALVLSGSVLYYNAPSDSWIFGRHLPLSAGGVQDNLSRLQQVERWTAARIDSVRSDGGEVELMFYAKLPLSWRAAMHTFPTVRCFEVTELDDGLSLWVALHNRENLVQGIDLEQWGNRTSDPAPKANVLMLFGGDITDNAARHFPGYSIRETRKSEWGDAALLVWEGRPNW